MTTLLHSRMLDHPSEAFVKAIESDLVHYHRQRMIDLTATLRRRMHEEERSALPNADRLAELKQAMAHANRNMFSTGITVRDILNPMRAALGMPPFTGESRPEVA